MKLYIIKPDLKNNFDIIWIDIQTPYGNYVIADNHAPMIISLSKSSKVNYLLNSNKLEFINVTNGIAHITRDSVTLLLNN